MEQRQVYLDDKNKLYVVIEKREGVFTRYDLLPEGMSSKVLGTTVSDKDLEGLTLTDKKIKFERHARDGLKWYFDSS